MLKLSAKNIRVRFQNHEVLCGVNAQFYGGTVNAVIGVNGAGKTVFIKTIARMIQYAGEIAICDNEEPVSLDAIAYVPQSTSIVSELTVFEMVLLGKVRQLFWRIRQKTLDEVEAALAELHLTGLSEQRFSTLSGGQKQMVIMAQSLVSKPKILLLDEPTSALDLKHQIELLEIAKQYSQNNHAITLVIMHDLSLAARFSDTVTIIDGGVVLTQGAPETVLRKNILEKVYGIEVEVTTTGLGYTAITPIKIAGDTSKSTAIIERPV